MFAIILVVILRKSVNYNVNPISGLIVCIQKLAVIHQYTQSDHYDDTWQ